MNILSREFYKYESPVVAKEVLGKYLVRRIDGKNLIGKIVETESYLPFIDPAAHSYIGKTLRTAILFGEAGFSYVYSIHRYFCLNIVCDDVNVPGCVLIRAIEPIEGEDFMKEYRLTNDTKNITNGPGRLCQAMQINKNLNGTDLTKITSELFITEGVSLEEKNIITTTRIGISKAQDLPLRFYIKDNKFISKL
jgi:DNA-3-methyladenine glycosylase